MHRSRRELVYTECGKCFSFSIQKTHPGSTTSSRPNDQAFYRTRVRPIIPAAPTIPMANPPVVTRAPPEDVEVVAVFNWEAADPDPLVLMVVDDDNEVTEEPAVAVGVLITKAGHLNVDSSEAYTASSLVTMYLTSLGRLEYQSGKTPDFSLFHSEFMNATFVSIASSQVVGIAVARTDLTQLG